MKKYFFILIFIPIFTSGQQFKLGFDTGFSYVRVKDKEGKTNGLYSDSFLPVTFNLNLVYFFNKKNALRFKIGETLLSSTFNGLEIGLDAQYYLKSKFHVLLGGHFHSNEATGPTTPHGDYYSKIYFLKTGLGYRFSTYFILELNYFYSLYENKPLYYYFFGENYKTVSYMLRLNFAFLWDL